MKHNPPSKPIPRAFYPYKQDEPFSQCISCHNPLLEDGQDYFIEKAIRKYPELNAYDVVFEYAMCLRCAEQMHHELSQESKQKIQDFMLQNASYIEQKLELLKEEKFNMEDWLQTCIITGRTIDQLTEYQIFAQCRGNKLLYHGMPYLISGEAMDAMTNLLSNKTLGEMNRFINDNFGLPPELRKILADRPILLL
ncbi:MAG: hypothetical protein ACLFUB_07245 [Cyclobacteriaceae bacterium]